MLMYALKRHSCVYICIKKIEIKTENICLCRRVSVSGIISEYESVRGLVWKCIYIYISMYQ